MDNLENELKRKIRTRKFAIENLGKDSTLDTNKAFVMNELNSEIQVLYLQLMENIQEAKQNEIQDGYFPLQSNKRIIGNFLVFLKKVIRKIIHVILGWYIKPILEKQSYYNGKIVNSINLMNYISTMQTQEFNRKIEELENTLKNTENSYSEFLKQNNKNNEFNEDSQMEINDSVKAINKKIDYIFNRLNVSCNIDLLNQNNMDYFKFENTFRGTRSGIKTIQSVYIPYFKVDSNGSILDIGCGRGEFLELMWDNGIPAYGIDNYEPFVQYCNERGFNVKKGDALTYLKTIENCSLGGIFMSQVVEHLSNDYVSALISTAYKKLKPGCYFIIETPNPDCLAAISEFNIDMSHIKPVHYKALEYLFKEANYQSVERYHTEQSLYPLKAKHIDSDSIKNVDEFNQGIDHINELLFGYRDYTLIAKK